MKIYLAHQITGLSYDEVEQYYESMVLAVRLLGYEPLQPMTAKGGLSGVDKFAPIGYRNAVANNHAIFERDRWMVSQSDIVLVDLLSLVDRVSIGCMMELAWASLLGKHTIVIMEENSPHEHAFVLEAADVVFASMSETTAYLAKLARQET